MIAVIVDNHAHRLLNSGVVESVKLFEATKVIGDGIDHIVRNSNWAIVNPEVDLGITGGDFYAIKKQLEYLHAMFPEGRTGLPVSGVQTEVVPDPNAPRQ